MKICFFFLIRCCCVPSIFCVPPFPGTSYMLFLQQLVVAHDEIQIVHRSRHLRIVLRAVTMNASKLLLMGLLMFSVLFLFAIVNWRFFRSLFQSPPDGLYCDTVLQCLLSNLYWGYFSIFAPLQFMP